MTTSHTIKTLNDLLKVPAERRRALFDEIEQGLLLYELAWGDDEPENHEPIVFTWTDDGRRDTTLSLPDGTTLLELKVETNPTGTPAAHEAGNIGDALSNTTNQEAQALVERHGYRVLAAGALLSRYGHILVIHSEAGDVKQTWLNIPGIGFALDNSGAPFGAAMNFATREPEPQQVDGLNAMSFAAIRTDANGLRTSALASDKPGAHYAADCPATGFVSGISFQSGNPADVGVNGWTNEALLAVLIHRTEILDSQFPAPENKLAIHNMKQALEAFQARTVRRQRRGVEGKQEA